jgi:hypothetical protein
LDRCASLLKQVGGFESKNDLNSYLATGNGELIKDSFRSSFEEYYYSLAKEGRVFGDIKGSETEKYYQDIIGYLFTPLSPGGLMPISHLLFQDGEEEAASLSSGAKGNPATGNPATNPTDEGGEKSKTEQVKSLKPTIDQKKYAGLVNEKYKDIIVGDINEMSDIKDLEVYKDALKKTKSWLRPKRNEKNKLANEQFDKVIDNIISFSTENEIKFNKEFLTELVNYANDPYSTMVDTTLRSIKADLESSKKYATVKTVEVSQEKDKLGKAGLNQARGVFTPKVKKGTEAPKPITVKEEVPESNNTETKLEPKVVVPGGEKSKENLEPFTDAEISALTTFGIEDISRLAKGVTSLYLWSLETVIKPTVLAALPSTITSLSLPNLNVASAQALPATIWFLTLGIIDAATATELPETVTSLNLDSIDAATAPALPATITSLTLDSIDVATATALPATITSLTLDSIDVATATALPETVTYLSCLEDLNKDTVEILLERSHPIKMDEYIDLPDGYEINSEIGYLQRSAPTKS